MNSPQIIPGKIRCKFCNKFKPHATMPCRCEKKVKWNSPQKIRSKGSGKVQGRPRKDNGNNNKN